MSEKNQDNLLADDSEKVEASAVAPDDSAAEDFFSQLDRQVMGDAIVQPKEAQPQQTTSQVENPVVEQAGIPVDSGRYRCTMLPSIDQSTR